MISYMRITRKGFICEKIKSFEMQMSMKNWFAIYFKVL